MIGFFGPVGAIVVVLWASCYLIHKFNPPTWMIFPTCVTVMFVAALAAALANRVLE